MDDKKMLRELITIYVHNCNMFKNVKTSAFRKHILGEEDSDEILRRQATINQMIIKLIDAVNKRPTGLNYHVSPFYISESQISGEIQK